MTNESYWLTHEAREAILGTNEHFCESMGYKINECSEEYLRIERAFQYHSYIFTLEVIDLMYRLFGPNCITVKIKNITEGKEK